MNNETYLVYDYYIRRLDFLEACKELSFNDMVYYMKKNLTLDPYVELIQIQINLFNTALNNINWREVITELERKTVIKGWIKK